MQLKRVYRLRNVVLPHAEVAAFQIGNELSFCVDHRAVQHNFIHIFMQRIDAALPFFNLACLSCNGWQLRICQRFNFNVRGKNWIAVYIEARLKLRLRRIV